MHSEYWEILEFISQGGIVSVGVAAVLAIMSVSCWTIMVIKAIQARRLQRSSARFLSRFWDNLYATTPEYDHFSWCRSTFQNQRQTALGTADCSDNFQSWLAATFHKSETDNPFARIAIQGLHAADHSDRYMRQEPRNLRGRDEFIASVLRRGMDQEASQLETGLTALASIGSLSPFVGLFGTVCGIQHALGSIAASGLATVDKVAGPVGEALIMTAFGLAVAIPSVLAYNSLLRDNRLLMLKIESFAHDLHSYLTTGMPLVNLEIAEAASVSQTTAVLS